VDYVAEARKLQKELQRLTQERENIERRILAVSAAAEILAGIEEDPNPALPAVEEPEFEITASVRDVLQSTANALSVPEIRDSLVSNGWKIENYRNPLAMLHTSLKRLVTNGELGIVQEEGSRTKRYYNRRTFADREHGERQRDAEERARERAAVAARAEIRDVFVDACCRILRLHPEGISAKAIARELQSTTSIDMSCYTRPASAVTMALKGSPRMRMISEERGGAPVQKYYYPVQEARKASR